MKKKQTLASHGDLFLFHEGQCGYISDIVWKEKEQAYAYVITVMHRTNLFGTLIKSGDIKEYVYDQDSIRSFIEKSPNIKYYPVVK
jgi:hypothetical protein